MFWKFNPSSPQIDTVLFKEDLTLNELLDQENVLQELKSQNKKLVDIITRGDVMAQLVSLVTEEPSSELDERERYRRPNIACEVLTTDIPILNERLSEKSLLTKLYAFLETDPPLNPLLASFFSRTLSMLICRKTDQNWYSYQFTCLQVLDFFKSRDNSLELLLKHLGTSAIMDLTLKLITQVEGTEMQQNILSWLQNEGLIENLISLFRPSVDSDRHYNAAQLLCDTIRKLRENIATINDRRGDPILEAIQSPETIGKMLDYMLGEELKESSIVGGISVLLTLLEPTPSDAGRRFYNNQEDTGSGEPAEAVQTALQSVISAIVPYLPKLHDLLINPPKKDPVKLACGNIDPPLGNTRLSVIKLFSALIATNSPEVNTKLDQLETVKVLLDLFFHYTWNNFLHTQVDKCLAFALNAPSFNNHENNLLISNIFIKCRLLQRILGAWEDNEAEQDNGGKRRGYMGHLTNIANTVVRQTEGSLGEFLNQNIDPDTLLAWQHYVENTLTPINEIQEKCLGGKHPAHNTPKDGEGDFKDIRFPDDATLQQSYSDYQQKAQDYAQNYMFASFDNIDQINAQEEAELKAREQVFKDMCTSLNQIGPDMFNVGQNVKFSEEEVWVEMPNSVWNTSDEIASNSSDEEEKVNPEVNEEGFVDADQIYRREKFIGFRDRKASEDKSLWSTVGVGTPVVDPGNPWLKLDPVISQTSESNEGWADFDSNFENDVDIEQQFQAVQLTSDPCVNLVQSPMGEDVPLNMPEANEVGTSHTDVVAVPAKEDSEKSDNNANLNSLITQEDNLPDDELIDNFRFLSKQGMIAENVETSNQEQKVETKEDRQPETSISECAVMSNETVERKNEVPGEPV